MRGERRAHSAPRWAGDDLGLDQIVSLGPPGELSVRRQSDEFLAATLQQPCVERFSGTLGSDVL